MSDRQNCGNMLAAVGPFGLERGLIGPAPEGTHAVTTRIYMVNTDSMVTARFAVGPDGLPDYVVAMLHTGGNAVDSSVVCFQGDGAGTPNVGTFQTLPLPPATTVGSYIPSVQVEDFNRDGVAGTDEFFVDRFRLVCAY